MDYALQAWLSESIMSSPPEILRTSRKGLNWQVFRMLTVTWKPVKDNKDATWNRALLTSRCFMLLLKELPARAQLTFATAGGVRIPTWEWAHKPNAEVDGHKHCLGVEAIQSARAPTSRGTICFFLTQDLFNQQYGQPGTHISRSTHRSTT